jgi:hypothetical protein
MEENWRNGESYLKRDRGLHNFSSNEVGKLLW